MPGMRQLGNRRDYDSLILACDVGGTNTSVALVGRLGTRFDILHRVRHSSRELTSLEEALQQDLTDLEGIHPEYRPDRISISGAGPVRDNVCRLSNVSWKIDGHAVAAQFGIPSLVINDFSAISYGIPLLDVEDREQITPIPLKDGTFPPPRGNVQAVVGAGTGLGFGYLVERAGRYEALPSEGGHASFAAYDELSGAMLKYLREQLDILPGSELFVSGQGLVWAHRFFVETGKIPPESPLHPDNMTTGHGDEGNTDIAAAVSRAAGENDPAAGEIMRLFVRNYGRVASDGALHFLPTNGLFLAGGIVTKNERWFLQDNLFSTCFTMNYRKHIAALLAEIPVYIIKDYAISLYGAAHAAYALEGTYS
jgi:glucokinase